MPTNAARNLIDKRGNHIHQIGAERRQKTCSRRVKGQGQLLDILKNDPFQNPPPYEKLVGDLASAYSRRINIQHRLIYQVLSGEKQVKVLRLWSHYE